LDLAQIPEEYLAANFYNAKIDQHNESAYKQISDPAHDISAAINGGRNYFIYGAKTGSGKTYLASCIMNHFLYKNLDRFDFENPLALFVFYPELMNTLRYSRDDEDLDRLMDQVKNVPVLLLDDIGAGTMTDFSREQTTLIVNHRMNKRLSTIVTSNFKASQLREESRLGSRIISRLVNKAMGIELEGKDRRLGS
jgi:DNA replication protein DnaC